MRATTLCGPSSRPARDIGIGSDVCVRRRLGDGVASPPQAPVPVLRLLDVGCLRHPARAVVVAALGHGQVETRHPRQPEKTQLPGAWRPRRAGAVRPAPVRAHPRLRGPRGLLRDEDRQDRHHPDPAHRLGHRRACLRTSRRRWTGPRPAGRPREHRRRRGELASTTATSPWSPTMRQARSSGEPRARTPPPWTHSSTTSEAKKPLRCKRSAWTWGPRSPSPSPHPGTPLRPSSASTRSTPSSSPATHWTSCDARPGMSYASSLTRPQPASSRAPDGA